MKLRCTHNSIRIRVRKSDLQYLEKYNKVEETIQFGPAQELKFNIQIGKKYNDVKSKFDKGIVEIHLPAGLAEEWINSNQVGIEAFQELQNANRLHILIEKDFPCLDRENEDKADTFFELAPDKPEVC